MLAATTEEAVCRLHIHPAGVAGSLTGLYEKLTVMRWIFIACTWIFAYCYFICLVAERILYRNKANEILD